MMKGKLIAAVLGGALLVAAPAEAQVRTVSFGVGGGVSLPVGDLGDHFGTGWHIQGSALFAPMTLPFGVRADLFYQSMPDDIHDDENFTTLAFIANGLFNLGAAPTFQPYLTAGAGVYNSRFDEGESTDLGLNGGLGLRFGLGGVSAMLEGKFHHLFTSGESTQFIPISFGILF
jgi:hypothetical protein